MIVRSISMAVLATFGIFSTLGAQETKSDPPRVEVVFVLDSTGSMGGLIEGAKQKIWSIANTIARGTPTPEISVGLVAYRDKGDAYVTKVTPLSDNLDKIYTDLNALTAGGGGDFAENVRQAIHDALTKIKWSTDNKTLRIIFLVGDAPAHLDYKDVPTIEELCLTAAKAEIIMNTIRCGGNNETGVTWEKIARLSEGRFFSISSSGSVVSVPTPYDTDLGVLSDKLGKTIVPYGKLKDRKARGLEEKSASSMAAPSKADRVESRAFGRRLGMNDLVDSVREKRVKIEDVKTKDLPAEMQKMTMPERKAHLEKKSKEREEIREKVKDLSQKRQNFIKNELKKLGTGNSFDQVVEKALREQAAKKGLTIK